MSAEKQVGLQRYAALLAGPIAVNGGSVIWQAKSNPRHGNPAIEVAMRSRRKRSLNRISRAPSVIQGTGKKEKLNGIL